MDYADIAKLIARYASKRPVQGAIAGGLGGALTAPPGQRLSGGATGSAIGLTLGSGTALTTGIWHMLGYGGEPTKEAAAKLIGAMRSDGLDPKSVLADLQARNVANPGTDIKLADVLATNPAATNTRALLGQSLNKSGQADSVADMLAARGSQQKDRVLSAGQAASGQAPEEKGQLLSRFLDARQALASPLYDAAYKAAPNLLTTNPELVDLLNQPGYSDAAQKVVEAAKLSGGRTGVVPTRFASSQQVDDIPPALMTGNVSGHTPPRPEYVEPSLELFDKTKQALWDMQQQAYRAGDTLKGKAYNSLRQNLVSMLDDPDAALPPEYKAARQIFASHSELNDAAELGQNLFRTPVSDITDAVKQGTPGQLDAMKAGFQSYLHDLPDTEAGDFAAKVLKNDQQVAKVKALFSDDPQAGSMFLSQLQQDADLSKTSKIIKPSGSAGSDGLNLGDGLSLATGSVTGRARALMKLMGTLGDDPKGKAAANLIAAAYGSPVDAAGLLSTPLNGAQMFPLTALSAAAVPAAAELSRDNNTTTPLAPVGADAPMPPPKKAVPMNPVDVPANVPDTAKPLFMGQ